MPLTDKQSAFVDAKVRGLSNTEAARLAGFAFPKQEASRLMHSTPNVADAIRKGVALRLHTAAPDALGVLEDIMRDTAAPAPARIRAACHILDRCLGRATAQQASSSDSDDKPIGEMSVAELEAYIRHMDEKIKTLKSAAPFEINANSA
jgi:hypothetical protein